MIRLLADENFNGDAVDGLLAQRPALDLLRVQDVGLVRTDDRLILEWAAENDRILLSHDKETVPGFTYERVAAGLPTPGVFIAHGMTVRQIIDEVLLIDAAGEQAEWADQVWFLPL